MAGVNELKRRIFVIDTGYLDEFYKVGKYSTEQGHQEVKKRFKEALEKSENLYVPITVIFELANHVAHLKNSEQRKNIAKTLAYHVETSVSKTTPFNIVPSEDFSSVEILAKTLVQFSEKYVLQGIGLTDSSVLLEAKRLREKYPPHYDVHIWTRDTALKKLEPDTEQNPFV